jgi:hypothetical protein
VRIKRERVAEQAAMALESLLIAWSRTAKPAKDAEIRAILDRLFRQLENPFAYHPADFAREMHKLSSIPK